MTTIAHNLPAPAIFQTTEKNNYRIEVEIFQSNDEVSWRMKIIDKLNESPLWEGLFPQEQIEFENFIASIKVKNHQNSRDGNKTLTQ